MAEQWRGWFAVIARHRSVHRQVKAYEELVSLHEFLSAWTIMPFTDAAADRFEQLRLDGVRIGSIVYSVGGKAKLDNYAGTSANGKKLRRGMVSCKKESRWSVDLRPSSGGSIQMNLVVQKCQASCNVGAVISAQHASYLLTGQEI